MDISNLTLGEIAAIEKYSEQPISKLGEDDTPKGLTLAALALVLKRRTEPSFTWNDAQALTMDDANAILGVGTNEEGEAVDPTEPRSVSSAKTRAKK